MLQKLVKYYAFNSYLFKDIKQTYYDFLTAYTYSAQTRTSRGGVGVGAAKGLGAGVTSYIYGIVRMCVPNSPLFQHCQVYDWPPFFDKKYMTDPIFLDWYMKGPTFSDIPVYAHIFHSDFLGCLFSWYSMN